MFSMRSSVLPENRLWADYYLQAVWYIGVELAMSLRKPDGTIPDWLESKFEQYVAFEESRIDAKLREVRYDIDALDTVYIVASPERVRDKGRVRLEKVCSYTFCYFFSF